MSNFSVYLACHSCSNSSISLVGVGERHAELDGTPSSSASLSMLLVYQRRPPTGWS
jgi:hypothetical protein